MREEAGKAGSGWRTQDPAKLQLPSLPVLRRYGPVGLTCWPAAALLLVLIAFLTSGIGAFDTPCDVIWRLWLSPFHSRWAEGIDERVRCIVIHVRLARVCLALTVGGALALAGAVYQSVLLTPLADPFTLGVSTGAAFGAALHLLIGWGGGQFPGMSTLPVVAFTGAVAALYPVYLLGRVDGRVHATTLVLAGIILYLDEFLYSRTGPRCVDAVEQLAAKLYPACFGPDPVR